MKIHYNDNPLLESSVQLLVEAYAESSKEGKSLKNEAFKGHCVPP